MLPIKKIYIDSRDMNQSSASHSDFKVDLPQSVFLPEDTVAYIDDVCIPVSWYTVEENRNNKFYFRIDDQNYAANIPQGNYNITSLNSKLVELMNNIRNNNFIAFTNLNTNTISIISTSTSNFEILSDTRALSFGYQEPLNSINTCLGNTTMQINNQLFPFVSGYVDLNPIRNVYITSGNLGSFHSMSTKGDRGIIKKVPVRANYNEMIYDDAVLGIDYIDVSRQTLARLEFQLKDSYGNILNLHGNHWSCSLVFAKLKED